MRFLSGSRIFSAGAWTRWRVEANVVTVEIAAAQETTFADGRLVVLPASAAAASER